MRRTDVFAREQDLLKMKRAYNGKLLKEADADIQGKTFHEVTAICAANVGLKSPGHVFEIDFGNGEFIEV